MIQVLEKLLALQELDSRIRDVERQLKDIPARKKEEEDRLGLHRQEVTDGEGALKTKQSEIRQFELENKSRDEKITKLRQQQLELKTNKEFKAMEVEIDAVKRDISALEEKELALMENLEAARGALAARQKALAEEQALVTRDVIRLDAEAARLELELQQLRAQREAPARQIEERWLTRYETVFQTQGPGRSAAGGWRVRRLPHETAPSVVHDRNRGDVMVFVQLLRPAAVLIDALDDWRGRAVAPAAQAVRRGKSGLLRAGCPGVMPGGLPFKRKRRKVPQRTYRPAVDAWRRGGVRVKRWCKRPPGVAARRRRMVNPIRSKIE